PGRGNPTEHGDKGYVKDDLYCTSGRPFGECSFAATEAAADDAGPEVVAGGELTRDDALKTACIAQAADPLKGCSIVVTEAAGNDAGPEVAAGSELTPFGDHVQIRGQKRLE
ncbi:hypothetical protein KEM48_009918, partial [Puccinia striiformis f. sp. tritici PST-130]